MHWVWPVAWNKAKGNENSTKSQWMHWEREENKNAPHNCENKAINWMQVEEKDRRETNIPKPVAAMASMIIMLVNGIYST